MSAADRWSPSTDRLHADAPPPAPAPPAWRVSRHEVKIGEVYYVEPGCASGVQAGRVRVDRVVHDNLDGCVAAYVEITVVYLDAPWPFPRRLAGLAIEYHLRRIKETP